MHRADAKTNVITGGILDDLPEKWSARTARFFCLDASLSQRISSNHSSEQLVMRREDIALTVKNRGRFHARSRRRSGGASDNHGCDDKHVEQHHVLDLSSPQSMLRRIYGWIRSEQSTTIDTRFMAVHCSWLSCEELRSSRCVELSRYLPRVRTLGTTYEAEKY